MELDCPRCKTGKLQEIELDDIFIDRCLTCAGLWFDQGELEQMATLKEVKTIETEIPKEVGSIQCPRCKDTALRVKRLTADSQDVELYKCPSCLGTWLDRGVLRISEDEQITQHIKSSFQVLLK